MDDDPNCQGGATPLGPQNSNDQTPEAAAPSARPEDKGGWDQVVRSHAEWLETGGKRGRRASLANATLKGINLRGTILREASLVGADLAGADLRDADLVAVTLRNANLQGACLEGANLSRAELRGARFQDADLGGANLRGANLRVADLKGCDLAGAILHEADLQDANLREARGLEGGQLGGANVAGAALPDAILKFEGLANVQEASKNAQNVLASILLLCAYTWLTIASTNDAQLVNNAAPASSRLPILGTDIPLIRFYLIVPPLLLCLYFYFHLTLQRLWEELAALPAVFPDGHPLDRKSYPWLLSGLIRIHVVRLRQARTPLVRWQAWLSIVLGWALVPATLVLVWGRYLSSHDWTGTALHIALLVIAIGAGTGFLHLAGATLRGEEHRPFLWRRAVHDARARRAAMATGAAVLFVVLSLGGIEGINPHLIDRQIARGESLPHRIDLRTWIPRAFATIGFDTFATLDSSDLSTKPPNWSGDESDLHQVKGADLTGRNLRYADAFGAFFANAFLKNADLRNADLREADLRGADLRHADLRGANLRGAKLGKADLRWALLPGASLREADLQGARLAEADLTGADLRDADLTGADLASAQLARVNWTGVIGRPNPDTDPSGLARKILARKDERP